MARVAFLGPPGTFTEEALLSEADLAGEELLPYAPVPEVITAVERGDADLGVVPIENSIEGAVTVTLDALAFETDLLIQREIVRPISLNLIGRTGTRLRDVRTVVSLPYASAQCRDWIRDALPKVELVAANSTADAVERVSRSRAKGITAIGTSAVRPDIRADGHRGGDRGSSRQRDPIRRAREPASRHRPVTTRPRSCASNARTALDRCWESSRSSRLGRSTSRDSSRDRRRLGSAATAS